MPDGVIQWFDPGTGQASIARGGRTYLAAAAEVEAVARHAGARVHFDIRRDHGAEHAVDVTLRRGSRSSHHHRRYGTLVGAHRVDTKGSAPFARPHPERGRSLASHPLEVVRAWVEYLQVRDLDGALSLYSPGAVLHAGSEQHAGRSQIGAYLEAGPFFGNDHDPDIRGEDATVLVRWDVPDPAASVELRCRVEHGLLAEQWAGPAPAPARAVPVEAGTGSVAMAVATRGAVDDADVEYAVERIAAVLRHLDEPVLFARLNLARAGDPARAEPDLVKVALDVDGELVRAHVAARGMREAADLLQRRLRDQLEQRAQHREALRSRSGRPEPGEWRHGDLPTERPEYFDRPTEERRLVRHKTFAVDELTLDEAAFDMEQLDYDFHLFRDLASGEDSVIERLPEGGYRVTRLHPATVDPGPVSVDVAVDDTPPAVLTVHEAKDDLDLSGAPFVFFVNAATGRGNVVYRRYDGHYGLVTPA